MSASVEICLQVDGRTATVEVTDDGDGFEPTEKRDSFGLGIFSMRERVALVDGVFELVSGPGMGTRVRATVPVEPKHSLEGEAS